MIERITSDMKTAMKAGEKDKIKYLRLMMAELKNAEKTGKDFDSVKVLQSYKKKLEKAATQYAQLEQYDCLLDEINLVSSYLPQEASEGDIKKAIQEVLGSTDKRDFGPLMGMVMKKVDNADGKLVGKLLRESL